MTNHDKIEFGDYQTPPYFTDLICKYLKEHVGSPDVIVEPTCGTGNFLTSASRIFEDSSLYGIEINQEHIDQIHIKNNPNMHVFNENIFDYDFNKIIDKGNSYFIIGNPPWVTNSVLSQLNSSNLPKKFNVKNSKGINSILGESNFDISESIILKIIEAFKNEKSTIVMLCKLSVAVNVFKEIKRKNINVAFIKNIKFNSKEVFNINASSCILLIQFTDNNKPCKYCEISDITNPAKVLTRYGHVNGKFYKDIDNIVHIDGKSSVEYRQGLKHDCARIMELTKEDCLYKNKNGDLVDLEDTFIYPLLKSSNLKKPLIKDSDKYVIVTQRKLHEDTERIKEIAPKTWQYLEKNISFFERRKSKIYKSSPKFSMFGIGDYTFSKYKVGISGFNKKGLFCLISSNKPIMLDDTCYFLSFDNYDTAYITMLILNSNLVRDFLRSIVFLDSKRPYTKKVLKRIELEKCIKHLSLDDLKRVEEELDIPSYITQEKYDVFSVNESKQTRLSF